MTDLQSILFLCPMMFLAGFMDAIAGGGGLISLPAYIDVYKRQSWSSCSTRWRI